jgi:hypothetical protein
LPYLGWDIDVRELTKEVEKEHCRYPTISIFYFALS